MRMNENSKDNKDNTILVVLKNIIMIFACIIVYQCMPNYWTNLNKTYGYVNIKSITLTLGIFIFIYVVWILVNIYIIRKTSNVKAFYLIEVLFYTTIIALPIYLFHAYQSEFKYIFLLIIIVTIIQYGLRYGVVSAVISAVVILGVDLIYAPTTNNINSYFENDLILASVFILVAWILGYYVDLENENKRQKENQLKLLNTQLEEQSMQRNDIEELLLKNNICFDILFENSQNAILVHKDDEIIYANESAAKLLGYKKSLQLDKKMFYNYYDKTKTKLIKEKYLKIINKKLSKVIEEETILNCNGDSVTVRNTSSFFVYEGQLSVLTFLLDITTERQLESLKNDVEKNLKLLNETREFNVLITEFFINISHEIKTPINVIYVAIQSMGMYLYDYNGENMDKFKEYLKVIKQNCFRMIRLVNNLLDITRFDSGFMKLNKKNHDIVSVVEDIAQSVAIYIKSKNIELIFDTNVEEKVIAFDDDKVERIILNLLSNAFKYTHSGGKITVSLEERNSSIIISVKDEGEGISKENLDIIFERFGQADRSLSREYEGSGIGLYLVKSFVEMHNGRITVNSVEGQGTEFIIILPVEMVIEDEDRKEAILFETNIERINIEFSDIYNID